MAAVRFFPHERPLPPLIFATVRICHLNVSGPPLNKSWCAVLLMKGRPLFVPAPARTHTASKAKQVCSLCLWAPENEGGPETRPERERLKWFFLFSIAIVSVLTTPPLLQSAAARVVPRLAPTLAILPLAPESNKEATLAAPWPLMILFSFSYVACNFCAPSVCDPRKRRAKVLSHHHHRP
jgi:hypothetical protein